MTTDEYTDGEYSIVKHEENLPPMANDSIIAIADQVEKRFDAMAKIKKVALKLTNSSDWVDQNGKPYLQASGAEKVARLFGISWRISEPTVELLDGGHFSYTYKGEFSLAGATIEAIGTRSSKDGFFKKYKYEGQAKLELPPSEIDKGDVKKSAFTNLLGNGITRILGLRNLTYADLEEYAGITKANIGKVEYKKEGKKSPSQQRNAEKPGQKVGNPNDPVTEPQLKAMHAMLGQLGIKDDQDKCIMIAEAIELKEVPTSLSRLTKGQASLAIEKLQGKEKEIEE